MKKTKIGSIPEGTELHPTHECFNEAVEFIEGVIKDHKETPDSVLFKYCIVHAICVLPTGQPYAHAWVEDIEGHCIFKMLVNGKEPVWIVAEKKSYYEKYKVAKTTVYTLREFAKLNLKHGHLGPYEPMYRALTGKGDRRKWNEAGEEIK